MDSQVFVNWIQLAIWGGVAVRNIWRWLRRKRAKDGRQAGGSWLSVAVLAGLLLSSISVYFSYSSCHGITHFSNDQKLTEVRGRTFENERVILDGNRYTHCTFKNITLVYNGTAPFGLDNNTFIGGQLYTDNDAVLATMALLKGMGILPPQFQISVGQDRTPVVVQPPNQGEGQK